MVQCCAPSFFQTRAEMLKRSASEGPEEELGEQLDNSSQQALQRAKQCTDPSGCFICAAQESSQWRTLLAGPWQPQRCCAVGILRRNAAFCETHVFLRANLIQSSICMQSILHGPALQVVPTSATHAAYC
jgi:hypothetical protein